MNKYPIAHLRYAMDPEWDLLQVIHKLMAKMKERLELGWISSHQDHDPDFDITKLSVAIKLNIKTDALATQGLDRLESNPRVLTNPLSEVLLHQWGRTITKDYKLSMRSNIQLLVMEEYYQQRFRWTNSEYRKIDWFIFAPVYRQEKNKHLQWANTFCMRKLPVGQRMHARESNHNERCCSCWADCETDDHLLQCPKRAHYRNEILFNNCCRLQEPYYVVIMAIVCIWYIVILVVSLIIT